MRKDIIDSAGSGFKNEKFFSIAILVLIIIAIGGFAILRSDVEFNVASLRGEVTDIEREAEDVEDAEGVEDVDEDEEIAEEASEGVEHYEEGVENGGVVFEETNREYGGPGYDVVVGYGEGLTHVARRALENHLERATGQGNLTAEHKVFIEDYIQRRIDHSTGWLEVGESIQVSESLINEAIQAANQLTDSQLQNLSQYTL